MGIKIMQAKWGGKCACGEQYFPDALMGYDTELRKTTQCLVCTPSIAGDSPVSEVSGQPVRFQCVVRQVRYTSPDGYGIVMVRFADNVAPDNSPVVSGRDFAIKGRAGNVSAEDMLEVSGIWEQAAKYGWQVKIVSCVPVLANTEQALRAFLAKFPHIGPIRAAEVVRHFGGREGTLHVLEHEPARLAEIDGITLDRAELIGQRYAAARELREVAIWLAGLEIGEGLTATILEEWGEEAREKILTNPYNLMELSRVGFLRADDIARTKLDVAYDDPRRAEAAALFLLEEQESGFDGGHTWTYERDLTGEPVLLTNQFLASALPAMPALNFGGAAPASDPSIDGHSPFSK